MSNRYFKYVSVCLLILSLLILYVQSCFVTSYDSGGNNIPLAFAQDANFIDKQAQQMKLYEDLNCGNNSIEKQTNFVKEIKIPKKCAIPIGIAYDEKDKKVWVVLSKDGFLASFEPSTKKFELHEVPRWFSKNKQFGMSWSWDIKLDKSMDNVWFTDEKQDSLWKFNKPTKTFYQYIIPTKLKYFSTSYPISFDFYKDNKIFFVGIRTPSLWYGDMDQMKNGTTEGIHEIPIPLDKTFTGIPENEVGIGSLVLDNNDQDIWITALAFNKKGAIINYDIPKNSFKVISLPDEFRSPVGIAVDKEKNLWVTDHGTSSFYKVDTRDFMNGKNDTTIEHFVTSSLSSRILGIDYLENPSYEDLNLNASTLPYWIKFSSDGSLWFNEHVGNKIAKFEPNSGSLTEYWIPTQNKMYSNCNPNQNQDCGYSNILQFDLEHQGNEANSSRNGNVSRIWFSEQSENKIGHVDAKGMLPVSIKVDPQYIEISKAKDNAIEIGLAVYENGSNNHTSNIQHGKNETIIFKPIVSSTATPNGGLKDMQVLVYPSTITINKADSSIDKIKAKFTISNLAKLDSGNYNMMVGIEGKEFSLSKNVRMIVSD
jgi:virginiamycin B lyase